MFLFAPLVGLFLGVASIAVPWSTLLLSALLYIVVPVIGEQGWRSVLLRNGDGAFERTMKRLQPVSLVALLATLVLLFGFQGEQIIRQPVVVAMLSVVRIKKATRGWYEVGVHQPAW